MKSFGIKEVKPKFNWNEWKNLTKGSDELGHFVGLGLTTGDILDLLEQKESLESELDAIMYLGVEKWFDDPEAELEKSNRSTMAAHAREIALKAIEKEYYRAQKAIELLELAVVIPEGHESWKKIEEGLTKLKESGE